MGITQNQVSRYERGVYNPPADMLAVMARTLDTTTDYLLGLTDKPHPDADPDPLPDLTPDEIEWLTLYRERDPDTRKRLLDAIRALYK